jgi:hypothetical protein
MPQRECHAQVIHGLAALHVAHEGEDRRAASQVRRLLPLLWLPSSTASARL